MPVYKIDLKVAATLYVKAEDLEKAKALARPYLDPNVPQGLTQLEYDNPPTDDEEDIYVSAKNLDSEDLPILSLGTEMTLWGSWYEDDNLEEVS
jgi:hypothetical protein